MSGLSEAARETLSDVSSSTQSDGPRKRGRPKGSKNRIIEENIPHDNRPPYEPTEAGVKLCSILANTIWNVSSRFTGWSVLTEEEKKSLGEAMDPLLYKYLPMMDKWREELNFVVCIAMIVSARMIENKAKDGEPEEGSDNEPAIPDAEEVH